MNKKIYLFEIIGKSFYPIDSTIVKELTNEFRFQNYPSGYYSVGFSRGNSVEFIKTNEDISFFFSDTLLSNNVIVIQSIENKILWKYKYFSRSIQKMDKKLSIQQSYFELESELWRDVQNKRDSLKQIKKEYLENICIENPNLLFSKYIKYSQRPYYSSEQLRKEHFFDNIDFSDPSILRCPVLPSTIMEYFQQYSEYSQEGFQESIDKILLLSSANDEVYAFCLNYILELFQRVGPQIVFQYVVENYIINEGCSDIKIDSTFEFIANKYRAVLPGKKASNFTISDLNNKEIIFYNELVKSDTTILFFWSSHCGFCSESMPKVKKIAEKYKNIQIIGISIDTNKNAWKNYIEKNQINWLNVSELKGWNSEVVKLYMVHKTPSYYVVNKEGIILDKPNNVNELEKLFVK